MGSGTPGCPGPVFPMSLLLLRLCFLHGATLPATGQGLPPEGECRPHPSGAPEPGTARPSPGTSAGYPAGWPSLFSPAARPRTALPQRDPTEPDTAGAWGPRPGGAGLQCAGVGAPGQGAPSVTRIDEARAEKMEAGDYRRDLKFLSTHCVPGTPKDPTPWASDELEDWALGGRPASRIPPTHPDLRQKLPQRQQRRRQAPEGPRPPVNVGVLVMWPNGREGRLNSPPTAAFIQEGVNQKLPEVLLHTARIPITKTNN